MSQSKDCFDDTELTTLAMEILKDLSTKPANHHNDAFLIELAQEIEKDILNEMNTSYISSSSYTDNALYLKPSTTANTSSTPDDYNYNHYVPHPQMRPTIVSRRQLSHDDSFNKSLPSIPSPKPNPNHSKFPTNHKCKQTASKQNTRFFSPYLPPPKIILGHAPASITNGFNIGTISPRNKTSELKTCQIPNFTDDMSYNKKQIRKLHIQIESERRSEKLLDLQQNKGYRKIAKNGQQMISPRFVGRNIPNKHNHTRKTRQYCSTRQSSMTPKIYSKNRKGKRNTGSKTRSYSVVLEGKEM